MGFKEEYAIIMNRMSQNNDEFERLTSRQLYRQRNLTHIRHYVGASALAALDREWLALERVLVVNLMFYSYF